MFRAKTGSILQSLLQIPLLGTEAGKTRTQTELNSLFFFSEGCTSFLGSNSAIHLSDASFQSHQPSHYKQQKLHKANCQGFFCLVLDLFLLF